MKFSITLIAKNEEKTLPKLLESVKGADEIVLVDTGSTDNTIEIAKSYGVKIFEKKFDIEVTEELKKKIDELIGDNDIKVGDKAFDFAAARNWAAQQAKNDMIFMPDCDEVVEWNLTEVEKLLDGNIGRLKYHFIFSWDEYGNPSIEFEHSKFYNRTTYEWRRIVHEVLYPKERLGKEVYTKEILLKHYQNPETNRGHYLKGLALDYILNGYDDRNMHYFGRELYGNHKYKEAIEMFKLHIQNPGWRTEQGQSLIFMGDCYKALKDRDKAIDNYLMGFGYDTNRREGILSVAQIFVDEKKWAEAERLYWLSIRIPKTQYYANISDNYTHLPWGQLSICLYYQDKKDMSYECLIKALEFEPENRIYNRNLQFYKEFRIPKIIHRIWVGPNPMPTKWTKSWEEKHLNWEFQTWNNERVESYPFKNKEKIMDCIKRGLYPGATDLIRYEILHDIGGVVAPIDSECFHPIDRLLNIKEDCFCCYENETVRPGLLSPHLGAVKGSKLLKIIIERVGLEKKKIETPWQDTGNLLLTNIVKELNYPIKIYPSHYFIPNHYEGGKYEGKDIVYADHKWGTTNKEMKQINIYE